MRTLASVTPPEPQPHPKRRSVFADKLRAHEAFATGDDAIFKRRGQWRSFFRERVGPTYDGTIIVEIGCFEAGTLIAIAAKHPNSGFIGIDWKARAIFIGAEAVASRRLQNVALLRGRAQDLTTIFAEGEIDEILVFHPDPCDQPAELQNRLMGEPFLRDAHRVLGKPGSTLTLKTDHVGYYQWTLALFGLPEPDWQRPNPLTRVRQRDRLPSAALPAASAFARDHFSVESNSSDFWNDPLALSKASSRCFAGEVTFFERRFIDKRQPIFYFEIAKR